jgi:HAD superfamily hydrolase (TIGR01509 family)
MITTIIFDYGGVLRRYGKLQRKLLYFARELEERGYTVAVLSNMSARQAWMVRRLKDLDHFKFVVISHEVGDSKPDKAIYLTLLNQLNTPSDKCLFIDNREINLKTAKQLGMQTLLARGTKNVINEIEMLLRT